MDNASTFMLDNSLPIAVVQWCRHSAQGFWGVPFEAGHHVVASKHIKQVCTPPKINMLKPKNGVLEDENSLSIRLFLDSILETSGEVALNMAFFQIDVNLNIMNITTNYCRS